MIQILGLQAAMFPGAAGGWGQWAWGVVFEDWHGLRDRVASGVPGGSRIVAAVNAITGACPPGPLSSQGHKPWPSPVHDHRSADAGPRAG